METLDNISVQLKEAMINKNSVKLKTLRLIKSEITKAEKDGVVINDTTYFKILTKLINQREDAYNQYIKANRNDLAQLEKEEIDIINELLPKQPSEEEIIFEINNVINDYIASKEDNFKLSLKDMKPILLLVQNKYPTVNGKIVSNILKTYMQ